MDWIKRNLMFVIGSAIALVLMGLAGFYLYTGMTKNDEAVTKLNEAYTTLGELNKQNPHPGDEKTDNVKTAKEQEVLVRSFISKTSKVFQQIPSIPASGDVDSATLAGALRLTVDQMRKDANNRGVQVVTNYNFSFAAVQNRIQFDKVGVGPLAVQLGEVKAISDVLFAARVNAIDGIRREKVSVHDTESQQTTDYLDQTTITNDNALISPYEITIRCFSPEIAGVLAGFANSPYGLVVREINVEPAVNTGVGVGLGGEMNVPNVGVGYPPMVGGLPRRPSPEEGFLPPGAATPPPAAAVPGRGGLQTLLDEKQLKVTMLVEVVKPVAPKPSNPKH